MKLFELIQRILEALCIAAIIDLVRIISFSKKLSFKEFISCLLSLPRQMFLKICKESGNFFRTALTKFITLLSCMYFKGKLEKHPTYKPACYIGWIICFIPPLGIHALLLLFCSIRATVAYKVQECMVWGILFLADMVFLMFMAWPKTKNKY